MTNYYTHTAFLVAANGRAISAQTVRVEDGAIVASNGHWSPNINTRAFDAVWRSSLPMDAARVDLVRGTSAFRRCVTRGIADVHREEADTGRAVTHSLLMTPQSIRDATILSVAGEAREDKRADLEAAACLALEDRNNVAAVSQVVRYVRSRRSA